MVYFIDTNIFLRVLEQEDKKTFNECFLVLKKIKGLKIKAYTSTLVIAEIAWVLGSVYKESKENITKGIDGIIKLNNLKIIDSFDISRALDMYSKHNVKFIDALLASNQKIYEKKMAVVSYDGDFDKLGIIRRKPSDII